MCRYVCMCDSCLCVDLLVYISLPLILLSPSTFSMNTPRHTFFFLSFLLFLSLSLSLSLSLFPSFYLSLIASSSPGIICTSIQDNVAHLGSIHILLPEPVQESHLTPWSFIRAHAPVLARWWLCGHEATLSQFLVQPTGDVCVRVVVHPCCVHVQTQTRVVVAM